MTARRYSIVSGLAGMFAFGLLLGWAPGAVKAEPADEGIAAYGAREFETAMALLLPHANGGDATAQYYVGLMFQKGQGVKEDLAAAAGWLGKAAEQGRQSAQKILGDFYYLGTGVPKDHAQSAVWYRRAAEAGHPEAQFMLGHMFHHGLGVPKNHELAAKWYRTAADQGYEIGEVLDGLE